MCAAFPILLTLGTFLCRAAEAEPPPRTVRVRIGLGVAAVAAPGYASVLWSDGVTGAALGETETGTVATVAGGARPEARWGAGELTGSAAAPFLCARSADGLPLRVGAGKAVRLYTGRLEFRMAGGRLSCINVVPLEEYVRGAMTAETPASFHPEAIKAMAVAVRSYAEASRGKHGTTADLCDTTHCQAYRGSGRVPAAIEQAVTATAGLVGLYDGRPIQAVYSADCGGRTESAENAWRGARPVAYLRGVDCCPGPGAAAYCCANPNHVWSVAITPEQLLRLAGGGERVRAVVTHATESGHVRTLALFEEPPVPVAAEGTGASPPPHEPVPLKRYSGAEWRRSLGAERVKSMRFTVRATLDGGAVVEGTGWGHGVGLCQFGAHGMACSATAPDFVRILQHYYQGITVGPLGERRSGGVVE